jgi:hypothetical protein
VSRIPYQDTQAAIKDSQSGKLEKIKNLEDWLEKL